MSQARFASITADILARKGEAKPWGAIVNQPVERRPEAQIYSAIHDEPLKPAEAPAKIPIASAVPRSGEPRPPQSGWKKCTVRVSNADYERLGIMAVKHNSSRHQLLQEALAQFFDNMTRRYKDVCPCLGACDCTPQMTGPE